jgi:uncharacterized membrane protein
MNSGGMSSVHQFTFMGTPLSVLVSVVVVVVTAALGYFAWRRSGYSRSVAGLELLRVAIVALVASLLNQPEWVQEYPPESKPTIAVLWDRSASMQTIDVVTSDSATAVSRAAAIEPLTHAAAWQRLDEKLNVLVEPIAGTDSPSPNEPVAQRTDLHQPLMSVGKRVSELLGIVLISDGDWNDGRPPVEAASHLRTKGIPIFTVAAGSPTKLPDVELTNFDLPTFGTAGKLVRIPLTIDSSLPREYLTTVSLKVSGGETLSKDVRIAPMGRTNETINWKPEATGDYVVTVSIPRHADDTIPGNNSLQAPIAIRQEKLKVLVVESYPRWEYRYLRNALSRDPGVAVSCLLFHPGLDKVGGGSSDYIKAFPEAIEDLTKYDVIFLGDVGLDDGQLTAEQCELIKGLVEHQASGLVFIPGWQGRQFSLLETPLGDLCPVTLDDAQLRGWGSRTPGHFELTERGRSSLLTKLADTQQENVQVWEDLPGFQWYAPVVRAKAGSEVLAVHGEMSNKYGRLPLLATRTFGAGKVLFMGTDGAWRWRKGVEDKYHYRFWGQVVRWMAYQRNMAKGETMRLYYTPDQPQMRQTLTFNAHVMDEGGEPLERGDVVARIVAPSGKTETVRLLAEGEQWGVFQGRYVPSEPGKHTVTLACKETSATLDASFSVQGQLIEQIGRPARPDVLQELAMVSKGKSVAPEEIEQIMDALAELPMPPPSIRRLQIWSHPLTGALLVLLLGTFWVWRKAVGLI